MFSIFSTTQKQGRKKGGVPATLRYKLALKEEYIIVSYSTMYNKRQLALISSSPTGSGFEQGYMKSTIHARR